LLYARPTTLCSREQASAERAFDEVITERTCLQTARASA